MKMYYVLVIHMSVCTYKKVIIVLVSECGKKKLINVSVVAAT